MDLNALGKLMVVAGLLLAVLGALTVLVAKGFAPRLPGDFAFQLGNVRVFFPLASSILVSVLLTILLNWFARR